MNKHGKFHQGERISWDINILKIRKLKSVGGGSIDSVDPGWINNQQSTITVETITVETITSCVDPGGD